MSKKKKTINLIVFSDMTRTGFEPVLPPWKGGVLTAWPTGQRMAEKEGFEPSRQLPDLHP
jgi:hypothetical protein